MIHPFRSGQVFFFHHGSPFPTEIVGEDNVNVLDLMNCPQVYAFKFPAFIIFQAIIVLQGKSEKDKLDEIRWNLKINFFLQMRLFDPTQITNVELICTVSQKSDNAFALSRRYQINQNQNKTLIKGISKKVHNSTCFLLNCMMCSDMNSELPRLTHWSKYLFNQVAVFVSCNDETFQNIWTPCIIFCSVSIFPHEAI